VPGKGWFTYFRLYGPKQAYFDKTWQLNDIEEVKQADLHKCPLLALSGHGNRFGECLLSEANRTSLIPQSESQFVCRVTPNIT
jgi:hypothetical protein